MASILMLTFYYLVLPFLLAGLLLRLLRRYAPKLDDAAILELYGKHPLEKKWFRAVRRDARGLRLLGDSETHGEAVENAYRAKEAAVAAGEKAEFIVLNDRAEILEEVDS